MGELYSQIHTKKHTHTGRVCDKKQTNQRIDVIHTAQPIIQVMLKSYHQILRIVEMRAI